MTWQPQTMLISISIHAPREGSDKRWNRFK